ncbi:zinc ribbon domain-containing protein [Mannheimia indoligenes]|uniref:Zinc ribbon domain-containing protein n=1 Tax=Mannheimia indoligenes TaxID=3103145 RepID=A0ABU7ZHI4_9PAST
MALHRCPECRKRISDSVESCPHCGFSFKEADLEIYRQKLEQRRLHNQEINRKSMKLQLIWLAVFVSVIGVANFIVN